VVSKFNTSLFLWEKGWLKFPINDNQCKILLSESMWLYLVSRGTYQKLTLYFGRKRSDWYKLLKNKIEWKNVYLQHMFKYLPTYLYESIFPRLKCHNSTNSQPIWLFFSLNDPCNIFHPIKICITSKILNKIIMLNFNF